MSLADDANLLLIPTGYKAQKLYSIFPTSGVGDFDFARTTSATRVAKNGFITTVGTNVPRLNYDILDGEVVGCPHLLLEDEAINSIQYSEDISNAVWTTLASGETIVSNSVISPDGTLNADTLEGDGTATNVYVRQDVTLSTSTDYTFSIFAKKGTNNFLAISAEGFSGATNTLLIFDLNNGIVTNGTANIEDFGNGWFRCIFTIAISTDGIGRFLIYPAFNGETRGFPSTSDANGQNIYLWGAMLEQSSFATSYIRNLSTGSTTRAAETCTGSGNAATFNDSEGVLMAEISALDNDSENKFISISNGSNTETLRIAYISGTDIRLETSMTSGTNFQKDIEINLSDNNKVCFQYKSNEYKVFVNGFSYSVTQRLTTPTGLNELSFHRGDGGRNFYGKTKQIQYHSTALSDSNLEKLTSWTSFEDMATGQLYTIQ